MPMRHSITGIILHKTGYLLIMALGFSLFGSSVTLAAQAKTLKPSGALREVRQAPGEWKKVLEAAKKEGKLVLAGDASEEYRKALVDLFKEDYPEIKVEYTGSPGRD